MLQLHLSYQHFYCLLRCDLYWRFYDMNNFFTNLPRDEDGPKLILSLYTETNLLALCVGNSQVPVSSPHKGPIIRTLTFLWYRSYKLINKQSNDRWFETTWFSRAVFVYIIMTSFQPLRQNVTGVSCFRDICTNLALTENGACHWNNDYFRVIKFTAVPVFISIIRDKFSSH